MATNAGPLTAAANALKAANQKFPSSMAKAAGAKTAHEFAHAPYSMAKVSSTPKPQSETDDVASGLKWRADQAKAIQDQ
jgi:hypothetical protein